MHYKNGREAKNGDKVVMIPQWTDSSGKVTTGQPAIGILYDAVVGNNNCNGKLARFSTNDPMPNLAECLHFDDILAALPKNVMDTSKPLVNPLPVGDPNPT